MIAIGQLLTSLNLRVVVNMVSGETTVDPYLLYDNKEFLWVVQNANYLEEVVDWVNENY